MDRQADSVPSKSSMRGCGRAMRRALAHWYTGMPADKLAMQVIKYQSRDGWSHRDILRKAHPRRKDNQHAAVIDWAAHGWPSIGAEPHPDPVLARIWAFERAKTLTTSARKRELANLIGTYRLPHECVPTEAKQFPEVWEALLVSGMGLTAMIRNLGKMTQVGLLAPMSQASRLVTSALGDTASLKSVRVHPMQILVAMRTYNAGHGDRGKLTWSPDQSIVDALDEAFYAAFQAVEPTGKNHYLALDISGSMSSPIAGMPLSACEASVAMALVTANVEQSHYMVGFTNGGPGLVRPSMHASFRCGLTPLPISPRTRLEEACRLTGAMPMGGTDCALPMLHAAAEKIPVDVFCIYTDNETWYGDVHPCRALEDYRQKMGRPAKLVICGMVSNGFTIADPNDASSMDVVGFDTAAPALIADFVSRELGTSAAPPAAPIPPSSTGGAVGGAREPWDAPDPFRGASIGALYPRGPTGPQGATGPSGATGPHGYTGTGYAPPKPQL